MSLISFKASSSFLSIPYQSKAKTTVFTNTHKVIKFSNKAELTIRQRKELNFLYMPYIPCGHILNSLNSQVTFFAKFGSMFVITSCPLHSTMFYFPRLLFVMARRTSRPFSNFISRYRSMFFSTSSSSSVSSESVFTTSPFSSTFPYFQSFFSLSF